MANAQSLSINTDGSSANASALLDVKSTVKGVIIPRMTRAQRDAIASPATGLMIFQLAPDSTGLYYYNGIAWTWLLANSNADSLAWRTGGNNGLVDANNFIGTKDNVPFNIRVNNQRSGRIDITSGNTFFGYQNGISITAGINSTAFGFNALISSSTGNNNTALGYRALNANTTADDNTAIGTDALFSNTTGTLNTATGFYSLRNNTLGNNNTAFGTTALYFNTTAGNNTAMGYQALYSQAFSNGNTAWNSENTAIGNQALYSNHPTSNSNGYFNSAVGSQSLYNNTTGANNTALGYQSLFSNNTGGGNSAIGVFALFSTTSGSNNTAFGGNALYTNTGDGNTAVGTLSLYLNTSGSYGTAVGLHALYNNTVAFGNTALGYSAGDYFDNGDFNTFIGENAYANAAGYTNSTLLGYSAAMTASNQLRIGNAAVSSIGGQVGWTTLSDARFKKNVKDDVHGLDFILQLKPVTYTMDVTGLNNFIGKDKAAGLLGTNSVLNKINTGVSQSVTEKEQIVYSGFLAQEVEKAAKKLGYSFSGVDAPKNDKDFYGLRYAEFTVPLVKAIQEQEQMIDQQQLEIIKQQQQINALTKKVEQLVKLNKQ